MVCPTDGYAGTHPARPFQFGRSLAGVGALRHAPGPAGELLHLSQYFAHDFSKAPLGAVKLMASGPTIVQVITRLIVGGAQLSVLALCRALRDEGFDVRIVIGPGEGSEGSLRAQAAEIAPVTVVRSLRREVQPARDVVSVVALRRVFSSLRPALVHTHSSKAGIVGRLAASRGQGAVVHTIHGWGHTPNDSARHRAAFVALERVAAHRTDALIAVSDDVRSEGLRLGIGRWNQYHVIPELVDYSPHDPDFGRARARARRRLGLGDQDDVIGWVGRFVDQKDPDTLSRSLIETLRRREGARAVLVGDGPRRDLVINRVRDAGLENRVLFAGLRHDVGELYAGFDVLVHPSLWEGQPRVVQEALAERVPVVATRVTGTSDLVRDGHTGFLLPSRDVAGFVDALLTVLDEPLMRAPLPQGEIERVAEQYGIQVATDRHMTLYEQLLSKRSG